MSNPGPSSYYRSTDNHKTKDDIDAVTSKNDITTEHEHSIELTAVRNNGVAVRNVTDDRVASFDYNFNPFEEEDFNETKKTENPRPNINLNVTSSVATSNDTPGTPDYINETVLYNQFDNINIDQTNNIIDERQRPNAANFRLNEGFSSSYFSPSSTNSTLQRPVRQAPPVPTSLNLQSQGQRSYLSSPVTPCSDDGLSLSPLPVTEYLDLPPAYSEATRDERQTSAALTSNSEGNPPRTRVILPATDIPSVPNGEVNRKYLTCQHCQMRVHTLVLRQSGIVTHVIAATTLVFCLIPLTLLVYWTKFFKYRNHYCPYCGKLIGFEIPILCQKMVFVDPQPV